MRSGFKTFVSFASGVLLATLCIEQARTTTSVPIRCLYGRIVSSVNGSQHCACNAGFMGKACDQPIPIILPPIRCENGFIPWDGTFFQNCVCYPGFTGAACDMAIPTTPSPISCENGVITNAGTVFQRCECNPGFIGAACDMAVPTIRCVHGEIANAGTLGQYCVCNPGFIGEECDIGIPQPCVANDKQYQDGEMFTIDCNTCGCRRGSIICTLFVCEENHCAFKGRVYKAGESFKDDCNTCKCANANVSCTRMACPAVFTTPPPIRCVNGVITHSWTSYQRCECNPGFTGAACDVHMPMEKLSQTDLIVGVSVGALILVAVILAAVLFCKRRQRLNNQQSAAHARRQPRDIRTGFSHGIYAIPGDLDFKLPPYTPPNFPPPYDHLDNKSAGLVGGKDSLSQPPPYYSNPGYQTMSSVRKESVGNEVVSVRFE